MKKIIAGLMVIFYAAGSGGEIYKWKDENGKTHYSDRESAKEGAKKIDEGKLPHIHSLGKAPEVKYQYTEKKQAGKNIRIIKNRGKNCDRYEAQLERVSQQLRSPHYYKKRGPLRKKKRELNGAIQKECW